VIPSGVIPPSGLPDLKELDFLPSFFHPFRIFGRTLSLILENIENYLLNCYDVVGLLIMIKVKLMHRPFYVE